MKRILAVLIGLTMGMGLAWADSHVADEIRDAIMQSNAETTETLVGDPDDYSSEGALEFWSSGGLLNEIASGGRPEGFDSYNAVPKHIEVISLAGGQAAVAMYYSEGSFKPKGYPAVNHYLTRVTQVFVKEGDEWKIRASHWSPVSGGSGTSQTALNE